MRYALAFLVLLALAWGGEARAQQQVIPMCPTGAKNAGGAPVGQWMLANNTGVTPAALGSGTLPTYHIEPMFAGSQSCYHLGGGS